MDVRAAVAFEAGKPLAIETVQLDGPKEGEVMVARVVEGATRAVDRVTTALLK